MIEFPTSNRQLYDPVNPDPELGYSGPFEDENGKEWVWNDQKQRWEPYLSTATSFAELTDKASADLPGINGPLATALGLKADAADLGDSATKDVGTTVGTVAAGDHNHSGVYQPAGSYATSAQGALADTALQPADVGTIAAKNYTQSDTPPSNPQAGDMWLETDTGMRFEFDGTFWVDIAGAAVTQANVRTALASGDNVELPSGQAATNDTSAMTRALGDARYGQEYFLRINTPVEAYSTGYVNGPDLVLPAGTYDFQIVGVILAVGETSGAQSNFRCSPTTDSTTFVEMRTNNVGALGTGVAPTMFARNGTNMLGQTDVTAACFCDAPNNVASCLVTGTSVFVSETTLSFRIRQRNTTDAVNPAQLLPGSYIRFIKRA